MLSGSDSSYNTNDFLRRCGKVESLQGDNLPLGVDAEASFVLKSESYADDDLLLLLTDGVFESANVDGRNFGIARTFSSVDMYKLSEPCVVVQQLLREITTFRGPAELTDDLTVVVVKFNG